MTDFDKQDDSDFIFGAVELYQIALEHNKEAANEIISQINKSLKKAAEEGSFSISYNCEANNACARIVTGVFKKLGYTALYGNKTFFVSFSTFKEDAINDEI